VARFLFSLWCVFGFVGILLFIWFFYFGRVSFLVNREKASSFECGFDQKKRSRAPLSLRFFFILLLFLVFDVELSLLLQVPLFSPFWSLKFDGFMVFCCLGLAGFICEEARRGLFS
jgi:NADH:ubiquinone oxidoreductase subunit 3 (subunit A)